MKTLRVKGKTTITLFNEWDIIGLNEKTEFDGVFIDDDNFLKGYIRFNNSEWYSIGRAIDDSFFMFYIIDGNRVFSVKLNNSNESINSIVSQVVYDETDYKERPLYISDGVVFLNNYTEKQESDIANKTEMIKRRTNPDLIKQLEIALYKQYIVMGSQELLKNQLESASTISNNYTQKVDYLIIIKDSINEFLDLLSIKYDVEDANEKLIDYQLEDLAGIVEKNILDNFPDIDVEKYNFIFTTVTDVILDSIENQIESVAASFINKMLNNPRIVYTSEFTPCQAFAEAIYDAYPKDDVSFDCFTELYKAIKEDSQDEDNSYSNVTDWSKCYSNENWQIPVVQYLVDTYNSLKEYLHSSQEEIDAQILEALKDVYLYFSDEEDFVVNSNSEFYS